MLVAERGGTREPGTRLSHGTGPAPGHPAVVARKLARPPVDPLVGGCERETLQPRAEVVSDWVRR